ncbi:MAG: methyltransferase domain-containing protein [Gammaproteobacteria bacterium]|nr:methyltransferase domain-containing protein [Gammaproteobacteria bacterium]
MYFYLIDDGGKKTKIRFHDYDHIYRHPGLYEQLFYDRLRCDSPRKVAEILKSAIDQTNENFTALRVLDLGAGNGLMGEALDRYGVSRLVGVDIIPEARAAMERDRPHVYDAYHVADFCRLNGDMREELESWGFNCLTTVAALGFGDIPPLAFMEAFNLVHAQGWVAFNIKETFFDGRDDSGFSTMIREMIFSRHITIYHLERYRHRLSMEGEPLYYYAIAAKKNGDIPSEFIARYS